jgi:hypothetical protein
MRYRHLRSTASLESALPPSWLRLATDSREMVTFELFVHDDRYSVPTLHLVFCAGETAARAAAEALLGASPHHLGVEVCCADEHIASLGACAERRRTGAEPDALRMASGG